MGGYITQEFATPKALHVFVHDATKVALKYSQKPSLEDSEVVCLFVSTLTGYVRIFCRERGPIASTLSLIPRSYFKRVDWQLRGSRRQVIDAPAS